MKKLKIFFFFLVLDFFVASKASLVFLAELNQIRKDEWLESHNYHRRLVSNPEAADMTLMTWDDELASLAGEVASTCNFTHTASEDLKTSFFPQVGENLYSGGKYPFSQLSQRDGVTKDWYEEVNFYNYSARSCETFCGHYTQVVWAATYKVGCAVARCSEVHGGSTPYLVSCNYGPAGNAFLYGSALPPYLSGESCSQCGGDDGCVDQLCNNTARDIPFTTTAPPETTATQGTSTDSATVTCVRGTCYTTPTSRGTSFSTIYIIVIIVIVVVLTTFVGGLIVWIRKCHCRISISPQPLL